MSSIAAPKNDWLESCLPCWFGKIPEKETAVQKMKGDWCRASLFKRGVDGEFLKDSEGFSKAFNYTLEISSGDLYGIPGDENGAKPHFIARKAIGLLIATSFYMLGVMTYHLLKIVTDIGTISVRAFTELSHHFSKKGVLGSMANLVMTLIWEIPSSLLDDLWHIARSPLFAAGILCASLFAVLFPFEGRKWIGKIELAWHDNTSYRMDIRHNKTIDQSWNELFSKKFFSDLKAGKVIYLANCMQKRGNLKEKIRNGEPRFEF